MKKTIHLVDMLSSAEVHARSGHVELQYVEVGGDERHALFQHPDSTVRLRLPASFDGGELRGACGVATRAWPRMRGPVTFRVGVVTDEGEPRWLHAEELYPCRRKEHRRWIPFRVSVPPGTALVLETAARRPSHAWAAWADPVVVWDAPSALARRPRRSQPNVLLITAEACRPDLISPPEPAVAALAADGIRCTGARTVSTVSQGSSASLLTGRYPFGHGVVTEWGSLPASVPNLATELARAGYHTVLAASRQAQGRPEHGFARVFAEVLPCLTSPNQQGDVTTRQVLHWLLDAPDDRPWFLWVSFFDTHPPYRLPAEVVQRFYDGDPRDPSRADRAAALRGMRGMDGLVALDADLPALRKGTIHDSLVGRLRDTARALAGDIDAGPDLATHIAALDHVRRGRDRHGFAQWLHERVRALEAGRVEPELLDWLDGQLVPALTEVDRRTQAWLDGVVDHRYTVAMARAGAAQVDAHVEELVAFLTAEGLYEQTTIVFCSPYVDVHGDVELSHHGSLAEAVLQVPLVIKPGAPVVAIPACVDGPIETIDLVPTLLDSLHLPLPDLDGTSRWTDLSTGRAVADHDTFAMGSGGCEIAITSGDHRLTMTLASHGDGTTTHEVGSVRLFRLSPDGDVAIDDGTLLRELSGRLQRWLASQAPDRGVEAVPSKSGA